MTRTDVHSPTNLVTEDYDFAYAYDAHPEEGDRSSCMGILNSLIDQGYRFGQVHGGDTCDHCGARLRYVAVLKHLPTQTLIKVGQTCLDNRFDLASTEFHALRKAAKLNRERLVMREVREEFSRDHADVIGFLADKVTEAEARFGYVPDPDFDDCGYLGFYISLESKLMRYGTLSERQVEAVRKGIVKSAEFAAKREEEAKTASPVIEGRVTITGEVQSVKLKSGPYGDQYKMVVKDDRGFKVYGTAPAALETIDGEFLRAGHRVTFTAKVEASKDDATFGFYSRPTKAAAA